MSIDVGDRAPGFDLPSGPGESVDVGDVIGEEPIVLLFFPLAFSSVCTTELRTFGEEAAGMDARIFAISVDSPFVGAKFRAEEELPFPVLSDFNRRVARRYGVLQQDMHGLEGVAKRSVFVVGRDGRVAYRWVSDDADTEPDYEAVKAAVEAA